jgi:GT2 family glycosyltransferase
VTSDQLIDTDAPRRTFPTVAPEPESPAERAAKPTFSILIASYQAAGTIASSVESVLDQTEPPLEIIVCDDGSTDDLDGVLAPYADRIVLLRQEHAGAAAARNRAARSASGDFVAILDADDAFLPERLEALGQLAAERPDLDILTTNEYLETDGRLLRLRYTDEHRFVTEEQELAIFEVNFVAHAAVRRAVLLEHDGFDESLEVAEDWELWIRMIQNGARVGLVDAPLLRYALRRGSLSADAVRMHRCRLRALEKALARPDLTPRARDAAGRAFAISRAELSLAEAREAVQTASPDARTRALDIVRDPSYGFATRAKAALPALSPTASRLVLKLRARLGGNSRGGALPPEPPG